jgi:hypothetical protein
MPQFSSPVFPVLTGWSNRSYEAQYRYLCRTGMWICQPTAESELNTHLKANAPWGLKPGRISTI